VRVHALEYLEETAARLPGKAGLADAFGVRSFGQLRLEARRLAVRLVEAGARPGRPVAVLVPRSADAVVSFLASLYAGGFYVPFDTKAPAARTRRIVESLGECVLVAAPGLRALATEVAGSRPVVSVDDAHRDVPESAFGEIDRRLGRVIDTDPVYTMFTSGSTGAPKGVVIPHRGVIDYVDWVVRTFSVDERAVLGGQAPLFFDNSTLDLWTAFATGATLVLVPDGLFSFPLRLLEYVAEAGVTLVFWVPSVMTNVAGADVLRRVPLPALRDVLFAGEVLPTRVLNHWRRHLPAARFANLYGPTEITVDCTYFVVDRELSDDEPIPIGAPCRNTDVLVLTEDGRDAGAGEPGELCVRGSSLALGYWRDPERTAAAFAQNPRNADYPDRIYRTGDVVKRNARGELVFVGRRDAQIKHLGYRIELGEIEAALRAIPDVADACVLYDASAARIEAAYVASVELEAGALRRALTAWIPRYMIPSLFHRMEAFPTNANGKVDRGGVRSAIVGAAGPGARKGDPGGGGGAAAESDGEKGRGSS
jgi:amino acid adenylation domain-containing protein